MILRIGYLLYSLVLSTFCIVGILKDKLFDLAVSKDLAAEEESALFRMLQAVAVPLIGNACHVFMNGLNRVQV